MGKKVISSCLSLRHIVWVDVFPFRGFQYGSYYFGVNWCAWWYMFSVFVFDSSYSRVNPYISYSTLDRPGHLVLQVLWHKPSPDAFISGQLFWSINHWCHCLFLIYVSKGKCIGDVTVYGFVKKERNRKINKDIQYMLWYIHLITNLGNKGIIIRLMEGVPPLHARLQRLESLKVNRTGTCKDVIFTITHPGTNRVCACVCVGGGISQFPDS